MAKLGVRTLDELIGRSDLLKVKDGVDQKKAAEVDLSKILSTDLHRKGLTTIRRMYMT